MNTMMSFNKLKSVIPLLLLLTACPFVEAAQPDIRVLNQTSTGQDMIQRIDVSARMMQLEAGEKISFSLANGDVLNFSVSAVKDAYQGSKVINALSDDGVSLLLTIDDKASFGSIRGNGLNYSISHTRDSGQILIDQNSDSFPIIDLRNDAMIPPGMSASKPGYLQMGNIKALNQEPAAKESANTVTILVLYSNEFANGFASPSARINQMIEFTNQSFTRSNINIHLRLAHAQAINFNNGTGISTLLRQITNGEGSFSDVEAIRNRYGADMVALLPFRSGSGSSGVAWINGGSPRFAYSVTQMSPNCCDSVFAHELGHNFGSGHERLSANPNQPDPCEFNFTGYSCGHGNSANRWGTVMSYLNSGRVNNVFSNPNLTCLGEPCGIPEGQTNAADNMRSFNITGPLVAAFRADTTPAPQPPSQPPDPQPTGTSTMIPMIDLLLDDEG